MAITKTTQFANRYGLNIEIYAATGATETPLMTIDFANVSDISLSGDRTWATGGQDHVNKIGFNNPIEGTFKLSTQIMTMELLSLMAGGTPGGTGDVTEVVFENSANTTPKYFLVKAETVWQDAAGVTYAETLTFHKACPKRAFNISYSGDGDPTSVDIEFDLMQDSDGKVLTVAKADKV
jgi:hypothetical protein